MTLRSQAWFDNPENPGMTALYIERYMNWGLTREELGFGQEEFVPWQLGAVM